LKNSQQWPEDFAIFQFSYDTELQLKKGNTEYRSNQKMLTVSFRMLSDILKRGAEEIYRYKAYPEKAHFYADALLKKYPCLKEPGSFSGCYWLETASEIQNDKLQDSAQIAGVSRAVCKRPKI